MASTDRPTPCARPRTTAPPVVAVANQKGGVGKTAIALGLASAAARCTDLSCPGDHRVLVIDVDPQANSTRALGVEPEGCGVTITHLFDKTRRGAINDTIHATSWPGVDVVPSELDVARTENDGGLDVPFRLREAMADQGATVLAQYDLVVIDCPPSVGRLLSAGMTAATHALLVTDAAADGLRGVANVLDTIHVVQKHINPELTVAGIVINRYRKTGEQDYRETELRDRYGDLVLPGRITERIALAEAHAAQHSIHDQHTDGGRILAALFDDLYAEVSHRIHPNTAPAGAHA